MADNSEGWSRDLNPGGAEGTDHDDQFGLTDLSERLSVNVDTEGRPSKRWNIARTIPILPSYFAPTFLKCPLI